jgi:hypothetical protein
MSGRRNTSNRRHSHSGSNSGRHSHRHSSSGRHNSTARRPSVRTPAGDNAAAAALVRSRSHHQAYQHPQIEDDLPNPTRKAYNVQDLARALVANAAGAPARFATRLDNVQLGILRATLPADIDATSLTDLREFLDSWVAILDIVFFFGKLIRQNLEGGFSLYRKSNSGRGLYVKETMNVRTNIWLGNRDPATLAEQLICTTFHLMLTAFFDLFGCECAHCARNNDPKRGGLGIGRGPPWIDAMTSLQVELRKEVPWRVDCSILDATKFEMEQSGWTPTNAQLAAWAAESLARQEAPPPRVRRDTARQQVDEEDVDHDHHRRTGVRQKEQTRCCIIM